MRKITYLRTVSPRQNIIKTFLFEGLALATSWPTLLLEVFLRRNFGERYFNMASAVGVGILLCVFPFVGHSAYGRFADENAATGWGWFLWHYLSWYAFVGVFIFRANLRRSEITRSRSTFDFGRFSLSTGKIHPYFYTVTMFGKKLTPRQIEIFGEPAPFFLAGLVLAVIGQRLGLLWIACGLGYSLNYMAAYHEGDSKILDIIDDMIVNEETERIVMGEEDNDKGIRFYARRPSTEEMRRKLANQLVKENGNSQGPIIAS